MGSHVLVCVNFRPFSGQPSCAFRGSKQLADWFETQVRERGDNVSLERTVCMGQCARGPNFRVQGGDFVHEADRDKLIALLDSLV